LLNHGVLSLQFNTLSASDLNSRHDDTVTSAPRTEKNHKNGLNVFEGGENLLQNGILHFVF